MQVLTPKQNRQSRLHTLAQKKETPPQKNVKCEIKSGGTTFRLAGATTRSSNGSAIFHRRSFAKAGITDRRPARPDQITLANRIPECNFNKIAEGACRPGDPEDPKNFIFGSAKAVPPKEREKEFFFITFRRSQ